MGDPATARRATYQEVLNAPEHMIAEIIDGDLRLQPRPAVRHARVSSAIEGSLFDPYDRPPGGPEGPGGWIILFEPEIHLDEHVLVPDLAGWRRERLPNVPDVAYLTLAPDWVCEVMSPSTARVDRREKKRIYAAQRVQYLWLVDPAAQTLEAYRLAGELWQEAGVYGGDECPRVEPFTEVELDLARWWA